MQNQNVIKIRCPHCGGKVGIDEDYYQELVDTVINCPHCGDQMTVPENRQSPIRAATGSHSLDRTQEIKMPPEMMPPAQRHVATQGDTRHCPHCGVEVGKRDRICITCGNKIPLPEPPSGFSQISA